MLLTGVVCIRHTLMLGVGAQVCNFFIMNLFVGVVVDNFINMMHAVSAHTERIEEHVPPTFVSRHWRGRKTVLVGSENMHISRDCRDSCARTYTAQSHSRRCRLGEYKPF